MNNLETRKAELREFCLRLQTLIINNLNDHQQKIWDDKVHVIEMSAYQALEARHKKLLESLNKISKDFGTDYCDGNTMIAKEAIEADEKASGE